MTYREGIVRPKSLLIYLFPSLLNKQSSVFESIWFYISNWSKNGTLFREFVFETKCLYLPKFFNLFKFKHKLATKILEFNATVAKISKKDHEMMSGICHSSLLQFRIREPFRKYSSNLSFLKSRKAQTQQVKY